MISCNQSLSLLFSLTASICASQVDKEQKQETKEVREEEMVALRTWNQQKDKYEEDTQVSAHISPTVTVLRSTN